MDGLPVHHLLGGSTQQVEAAARRIFGGEVARHDGGLYAVGGMKSKRMRCGQRTGIARIFVQLRCNVDARPDGF